MSNDIPNTEKLDVYQIFYQALLPYKDQISEKIDQQLKEYPLSEMLDKLIGTQVARIVNDRLDKMVTEKVNIIYNNYSTIIENKLETYNNRIKNKMEKVLSKIEKIIEETVECQRKYIEEEIEKDILKYSELINRKVTGTIRNIINSRHFKGLIHDYFYYYNNDEKKLSLTFDIHKMINQILDVKRLKE